MSDFAHLEFADYLPIGQARLYFVLHPTGDRLRGRVLLAGPFASERPHRYIMWVRWARFLASHGYETMRFDYRGVGESTGRFEDAGFRIWHDDLCCCADWFRQRSPSVPLVIHGLGMGALLGDRAFAQGAGNAFLAWLPPKSARDMLHQQLKIRLAYDFSLPTHERKTRDQYIAEIAGGGVVEVEGYYWTQRLWAEADEFVFGENGRAVSSSARTTRRPRHVGELDALAVHAFGGVGPNPLRVPGSGHQMRLVNPDLSACFGATIGWLNEAVGETGTS